MRSNIALIVAIVGSLGALSARADDTPIDIQTDVKGQYFLVEKGGTADTPTLVVKRAKAGYNYYVKREFDCAAHTVRYSGRGGESGGNGRSATRPRSEPHRGGDHPRPALASRVPAVSGAKKESGKEGKAAKLRFGRFENGLVKVQKQRVQSLLEDTNA